MLKDLFENRTNNQNLNIQYYNFFDIDNNKHFCKYINNKMIIPKTSIFFISNEYKYVLNKTTNIKFMNILNKLQEDSLNGVISTDSIFNINNITIHNDYINITAIFRQNNLNIYRKFSKYLIQFNKLLSFDKFCELFDVFLEENYDPICISDLILKNLIDYQNYGLSLKINKNLSNEEIQADGYFEYFLNLCARNDFYINPIKNNTIIDSKPIFDIDDVTFVDNIDLEMFEKTVNILYEYHKEEMNKL